MPNPRSSELLFYFWSHEVIQKNVERIALTTKCADREKNQGHSDECEQSMLSHD